MQSSVQLRFGLSHFLLRRLFLPIHGKLKMADTRRKLYVAFLTRIFFRNSTFGMLSVELNDTCNGRSDECEDAWTWYNWSKDYTSSKINKTNETEEEE